MLKKFLQILKGGAPVQDFDGSYLDYLLEKIRPPARVRLDACPEHDPVLVVVTEILRQLAPGAWAELDDTPLADAQSPALPGAPVGDDDTSVTEVATSDVKGASNKKTSEEQASSQHDERGEDDSDPSENSGSSESSRDAIPEDETSEDEASRDEEQLSGDDSADAALALADTNPLPAADISVDDLEVAAQPAECAQLNDANILRAGRIFLGLLIENDRLPIPMQLSGAEIMLARDLLLGYFIQNEQFESHAQELLGLVEQKFNESSFSQARILLRLFQTDRATRINNDRNLFYEDMILRMGVRRRNKIRPTRFSELKDAIADAEPSEGETSSVAQLDAQLLAATAWLDENLHITCHLFTRDTSALSQWREFAAVSEREGAEDIFLRFLPPRCWRPIATGEQSPTQRLQAHISPATVKQFMIRQVKSAYFVLRAVGDTGLEPFLDSFFAWTERRFERNFVQLMPRIYRETMGDKKLIDQVFELFFNRYLKKHAARNLAKFDEESIHQAAREILEALSDYDYNKIPAGHYDFGGLILDRLFGVEYPDPEFAFKLHRLT